MDRLDILTSRAIAAVLQGLHQNIANRIAQIEKRETANIIALIAELRACADILERFTDIH